ncbi:MAG TPA: ATP-binding protein [Candidatus Saccharimonadia bacterium]|nr:ATP-binding protein [Candidatus Saccharimonadia bacterium]
MKFPLRSIRWRLQVWHGFILLLVILGFCIPAHRLASDNQLQRIDKDLTMREQALVRSLMMALQPPPEITDGTPPKLLPFPELLEKLRTTHVTLPPNVEMLFHGSDPGYAYISARDNDGHILFQSGNTPTDLKFPPVTQEAMVESAVTIGNRRELHRSSSAGLRVVVGKDITPDREEMRRLGMSVLSAVGGVSLLALVGGSWLVGRAISPIKAISHTATRIAEGNLEERINIADTASELGKLSEVLNQTFERLHEAFDRQEQFTADASHELRTPIAILMSESQRILKRERTPEEYKEVIRTCMETSRRMSALVDALLLLARQDSSETMASHELCNLADIAADVVQRQLASAKEMRIEIACALESSPCEGSVPELSILVSNLVSNAIHHHHAGGGKIWVTTGEHEGRSFLNVRDDGPGIPSEDLPHLFERFYRVDKVRTQEVGHSGLGLAIAKAIADNHQAKIVASSEFGKGSMFELRMPVSAEDTKKELETAA